MTKPQFTFSLFVGVALSVLGSIIAGKATVGFSLIALGAAIAGLALFTRVTAKESRVTLPLHSPARRAGELPSNHKVA